MVGTISSVGHGARDGRKRQFHRLARLYLAGSLAGSAVLGLFLGYLGLLLAAIEEASGFQRNSVNSVVVLLFVVLALNDVGFLAFDLPTRHRQVPMAWKYLPGSWSPFVFGFSLGLGFLTNIYFGSFYAAVGMSIVVRSIPLSLLIMTGYGLGRAMLIWVAPRVRREPDKLIEALAGKIRVMAVVSGISVLAAAAVLVQLPP